MSFLNEISATTADAKRALASYAARIEARGGGWTSAETRQFDALNATFTELRDRRDELQEAGEAAAMLDRQRAPHDHIARSSHTPTRKSGNPELDAFLNGEIRTMDVSFAGMEHRALTKAVAGAGGNVVPTTFAEKLYEHMSASAAIRQTNATVLTTNGGENLTIPKTVSHGTAAIVGEGTAIAGTDPSFGAVTLGSWKYGELLSVSNELRSDSGIDLEGYLARQAGRALGNASGAGFITGTGTNQPTGIMTACGTGVTSATATAGVPTADNLVDLYFSVLPEYRTNSYWIMADSTQQKVRKLKDGQANYLFEFEKGGIPTLLGRPVVIDPNVAATATSAKSIAFGDFSGYYIRDVRGVTFETSTDFAFDKDMTTYRAILRTDGNLVDLTGSVKAFIGAAT